MQHLVVGFAFIPSLYRSSLGRGILIDEDYVVLVEKRRPDWQRGHFNGLGGHVEEHETPTHAMAREFQEECGLTVTPDQWLRTEEIHLEDCVLHVFAVELAPYARPEMTTDEEIWTLRIEDVLNKPVHPMLNIQDKIRYAIERLNEWWASGKRPDTRYALPDYQI